MKKILFPTDFSKNADNALDYAIAYVNQVKGHLTVVHVYDSPGTTGSFVNVDAFMRKEAFQHMEEIINRLHTKLEKGVTFDRFVERGGPIPTIAKISTKYDLVIMGTQGASGLEEVFLGSVTNAIIKRTPTPVLVIPSGLRYKPIKNVVLSLDNQPVNGSMTLVPVQEMLQEFKADLLLFHSDKNMLDKGIDQTAYDLLGTTEYTIDYTISEETVNTVIKEMVTDYAIDVLVMIRRERTWWKNLFHDSVTSREVFHAPVPVLILHEQVESTPTVVDKYQSFS